MTRRFALPALKAAVLAFGAVLLIGILPLRHVGLLWLVVAVGGIFYVAYRLWRRWV